MMQQKKPVLKKRSGFNSLVYRESITDVQGAPVDPLQRRTSVDEQRTFTAKFTSIRRACRATEPGEPAGWPEQPRGSLRERLRREPNHCKPEPGYRSRDCRSNDDDDDDHGNRRNLRRRRNHCNDDANRGNDERDDHSRPGHHRNPQRHHKRNHRNRGDQLLPSSRRPTGQYRQPRKRSRCPKLTCDSFRILLQGTGT